MPNLTNAMQGSPNTWPQPRAPRKHGLGLPWLAHRLTNPSLLSIVRLLLRQNSFPRSNVRPCLGRLSAEFITNLLPIRKVATIASGRLRKPTTHTSAAMRMRLGECWTHRRAFLASCEKLTSWYTVANMFRTKFLALLLVLLVATAAFGSAYQASPKLLVILIIDQFRGDYLERYHDEFGPSGFRTFTDRGAYFPACYYDYANTRTAPGHATIGTGTSTS